jgi:maltose O-acetyltransferase
MVKRLMHRLFSWFPPYRMAAGGYWYYNRVQGQRYAPSRFCSYGKDVRIGADVFIRAPEKMKVGDGVFVGANCFIDALGGFQLGNCCALAANTTVLTLDHYYRSSESIPWGEERVVKPVVIEDNSWIGMNASILPGVTIGEGAIVGLGAVVPKDVPPRASVVGNRARIVGYRDEKEYSELKNRGAARAVSARCTRLWIRPDMREKYADLLREVGYDIDSGKEYFEFAGGDW